MVTFYPMGRMGNYLFEFATAFAYAKRNNLEFTVPNRTSDAFWNPLYLQHLYNPKFNPGRQLVKYMEPHFHYTPIPFDESWRDKNIQLQGYFQSEKYFIDYREDILKAINYPFEMKKGVVAVHNRRGDYLIYKDKHPYVGEDWIERAMALFKGMKFYFFSDEIAWAKEKFGHRSDCMFSEGRSIEEDLIEMSQCEHFINSSSTFSWWSAWLSQNPDKVIVTPQKWFSDGWGGLNVKDVVPDNWIKL